MLPAAPLLVAGLRKAVWLSGDGEVSELEPAVAAGSARRPHRSCVTPRRRPGGSACDPFPAYDLLELVSPSSRPAGFCIADGPRGLADALALDDGAGGATDGPPDDLDRRGLCALCGDAAIRLLVRTVRASRVGRQGSAVSPQAIAWAMAKAGLVAGGRPYCAALERASGPTTSHDGRPRREIGLEVWLGAPSGMERDMPREPPPGSASGRSGGSPRTGWPTCSMRSRRSRGRSQADYASAATAGLRRRADAPGEPQFRTRRGGHRRRQDARATSSPASVWAEKNEAARSGYRPTRGTCSTRSIRNSTGCSPDPRRQIATGSWCARDGKTISACSTCRTR